MTMTAATDARHLLRWVFQSGAKHLTCQIDRQTDGTFLLSLIPHGNERAVVKSFTTGVAAFGQHAVIASQLRQLGWTVVAYTASAPQTPRDRALPRATAA